jgi:hypothetical protein
MTEGAPRHPEADPEGTLTLGGLRQYRLSYLNASEGVPRV